MRHAPDDVVDNPETSVPGDRYRDEDWLAHERREVFGRAWLVAGLSWRVAEPGRYITFDELGRSVVIVRGRDGGLRAFHNSCRHRGTRLVDGEGRLEEIRCPYHAWCYALDGRLNSLPDPQGFDGALDKRRYALSPVRVEEALGFVWLCFDAGTPALADSIGAMAEEIAPYRLDEMRPVQEVTWTVEANWKAVLDNASEWYHNAVVHGATVQPLAGVPPDFRSYGDHCRQGLVVGDSGWRRWLDARTARGGPYSERQMAALEKYVLFPNFLMNLVPCHLTVFQVWPVTPSRCRFFYGFYGRRGAGPLEWLRTRATWLASRYILHEDWRIVEAFQRGVAAATPAEHRLHRGEAAIAHFHRSLDRWVGG